jgi:ABC-type uncharacterized transport system involved in gliding motility auxiliary subunit
MMQHTSSQAQTAGFWDWLSSLLELPALIMLMVLLMMLSRVMRFM